jgi:hypothetical protein
MWVCAVCFFKDFVEHKSLGQFCPINNHEKDAPNERDECDGVMAVISFTTPNTVPLLLLSIVHAQAPFLLLIQENKTNMSSNTGDAEKKPIPAWKLRESMRAKGPVPRRSAVQIKKSSKNDNFDAPLPPAFKTMRIQRLAFAKQQDRRKNNDTWVSLNSSHPDKPLSDHINKDGSLLSPDDISDDDDDSFG